MVMFIYPTWKLFFFYFLLTMFINNVYYFSFIFFRFSRLSTFKLLNSQKSNFERLYYQEGLDIKKDWSATMVDTPRICSPKFKILTTLARHIKFLDIVVVVFFYCRAKTNTQIANSANIRRHDLTRREEAKD